MNIQVYNGKYSVITYSIAGSRVNKVKTDFPTLIKIKIKNAIKMLF